MRSSAQLLEGHLRAWLNAEVANGQVPAKALLGARSAVGGAVHDFLIKHDIQGVRYWYHAESESYFATEPGESLGFLECEDVSEVTREKFLKEHEL